MKHIFSVTQINSYIHRIFESDYALKKIYLKEVKENCRYAGHEVNEAYTKNGKAPMLCIKFIQNWDNQEYFRYVKIGG